MNRPIWDIISRNTQTVDSKLQKSATSVIKASIKLANIVTSLVAVEKELKSSQRGAGSEISNVIDTINDSLALLGHSNYQNCMVRRDLVKPELKKEFSLLCNHNIPYTGWLFGDDVSQTIKEIEDSSRMGNNVHFNRRGGPWARSGVRGYNRFRPYPRGRGNYSGSFYYQTHNEERKNSQCRGGQRLTKN